MDALGVMVTASVDSDAGTNGKLVSLSTCVVAICAIDGGADGAVSPCYSFSPFPATGLLVF